MCFQHHLPKAVLGRKDLLARGCGVLDWWQGQHGQISQSKWWGGLAMHVGRKWTLFLSIPSWKVIAGRGRLPLKRTQREKGKPQIHGWSNLLKALHFNSVMLSGKRREDKKCLFLKFTLACWGDSSVSETLALWAREPQFDPPGPTEKFWEWWFKIPLLGKWRQIDPWGLLDNLA